MDIISRILGNPILNGLGLLIGIVAIYLSYYFYRKSLRTKSIALMGRNLNLIEGFGSKLDQLQILYKGISVENVSISKLLIWNDGIETINRQDIVDADPFRIVIEETTRELLDVKTIAVKNLANKISISMSENRTNALVTFDYLDYGEGAVFQIIHTGDSSSNISCKGAIKGCTIDWKSLFIVESIPFFPNIFTKKWGLDKRQKVLLSVRITEATIAIFLALYFFSLVLPPAFTIFGLFFSGVEFLGAFFLTIGIFYIRRAIKEWRNKIPQGLDFFEKELLNLTQNLRKF